MKSQRNPDALHRFKIARMLASHGERDRACEAYLEAIEIEPNFAEAWVNLGILYEQMGEQHADEALQCLRRGAQLNPSSARSFYNLGVALARRKDRSEEAIQAFEVAISCDPYHKNALYALAVQWHRRGNHAESASYHRRYQQLLAGTPLPPRGSDPGTGPGLASVPQGQPVLRLRFISSRAVT